MVTSGFFGSKDHDRRYSAEQMGRIFDGVIQDGVYRTIGTRFETLANGKDMMLTIGIGRAWLNHTWTYNDAPLPLEVPQSELILKRIDAVVLTVDTTIPVRQNTITIVKGTPSSNPVRPTMIQSEKVHQYALAYIDVGVNVTSIRQADVTNMVGQEPIPYVISPLEKLDISEQVKQWHDQWDRFYTTETTDMTDTSAFWKDSWNAWYEAYTSENFNDAGRFKEQMAQDFQAWFDSLKDILDEDTAGNLKNLIDKITDRVDKLEIFRKELMTDRAIYDPLQDDQGNDILDSNADPIQGSVKFEAAGRSEELFKAYMKTLGVPVTLNDFAAYYKREFPIDFDERFLTKFADRIRWLVSDTNVPIELRRNLYRGRNLGSTYTTAQKKDVYTGTFSEVCIGDYWVGSTSTWIVVDLDYFPQLINEGVHHILVMATSPIATRTVVTNSLPEVGPYGVVYEATPLYKTHRILGNQLIIDIFGSGLTVSANLPIHSNYGSSTIRIPDGTANPPQTILNVWPTYTTVDQQSFIPTLTALYGNPGPSFNPLGAFHKQLRLFAIRPNIIAAGNKAQYWTSDIYHGGIAGSTVYNYPPSSFFSIDGNGQPVNTAGISSALLGIRPIYIIKGAA